MKIEVNIQFKQRQDQGKVARKKIIRDSQIMNPPPKVSRPVEKVVPRGKGKK